MSANVESLLGISRIHWIPDSSNKEEEDEEEDEVVGKGRVFNSFNWLDGKMTLTSPLNAYKRVER